MRALPAWGGSKSLAGGQGRVHSSRQQQALHLDQGEHLVNDSHDLRVDDLRLLRDAGADEDAADVLSVAPLDFEGRGDHWGDDGHDAVGQFWVVLADVLHHSRAGAGDVETGRVLLQKVVAGLVDLIGAVRHLDDVGEPGFAQSADDLAGGQREASGKRWSEKSGGSAALKEGEGALKAAGVGLGTLRADHGAVAAADAPFGHH